MQLPKVYTPGEYEGDIYALWEKSGAFIADPTSDKERFSIAMPPPNETGTLSLGHAMYTLQDIMARYQRLKGKDVLWLPGTDHAALPVNALIEKQLAQEGTNKHEIGREEFLRRTREFVANSRGTMVSQMRALGFSADWSRQRYTLDDTLNRCVNETFVKMYNSGLIYRGARIVNWDPNLETTVSDDEVVYTEEKAKFYTFKYGPFEIGTARPETKFGDKYVVMHPDDKRYAKYKHGETFETEWINGKITATVIKDESVDPEFGTGVMTITPWHSQVDFELAERYDLDKEQIIDFHGNLLPIAGEFAGMHISEARDKIVDKLKEKGLLVSIDENYVHNVAINERGKGVIEPQIKMQWWVDVNKPAVEWKGKTLSLKEVMQDTVRSGDITIVPARFDKTYFNWIDNLRDWCISRQIWWGHRIPVWYRTNAEGETETYVGTQAPADDGKEGLHTWEQDPDTLDTWFSSALWTWSTLIDPEVASDYSLTIDDILARSRDFQAYHPTTVMESGWDIIFFWIARMILATTYMTGQIPFRTVYLHGMVRAEDGKKMSKSRPESIVDPKQVIAEYGTDALRMGLIMGVAPGQDMNWSRGRIEANRNFCNKLWNVARFIEAQIGDDFERTNPKAETIADEWMLSELQRTADTVAEHLDNFRFSEAYDHVYHFVWDSFADWYIEASKVEPNKSVLAYGLESILKLVHPFAPFVTETIWQTLGWEEDSLLMLSSWPQAISGDLKRAGDFEQIMTLVSEIRFVAASTGVQKPTLYYGYGEAGLIHENVGLVSKLANLGAIKKVSAGSGLRLTASKEPAWLDLEHTVIVDFVKQLAERITVTKKSIAQLEGRLANKGYVANAPKELIDETKAQLKEAKALLKKQEAEYGRFK